MKRSNKYRFLGLMVLGIFSQGVQAADATTNYKLCIGSKGVDITTIKADKADSLLRNKLFIQDIKTKKNVPVVGFECLYAERGIYEDSTGRPILLTEYYKNSSLSDTLPNYFLTSLKEMYKEGDTIKISNIYGKIGDKFVNAPSTIIVLK